MTGRSKEPWRVVVDRPEGIVLMDADDQIVAIVVGPTRGVIDDRTRADARRIVACVNACRGIPTEILEGDTVEKLAAAIKRRNAVIPATAIDPFVYVCPACGWDGPEGRTGRAGNGPPICPQCLVAGEQVRLTRTPLAEMPPKGA